MSAASPWTELGDLPTHVNMAAYLVERARLSPNVPAIRVAQSAGGKIHFKDISFKDLAQRSGELAAGLTFNGIRRGDRVSLFVKPGVELIAITFALLRIGAIPVLIDPGMGPANVLSCVERMAPAAFIGIPIAHVIRRVKKHAFRSVKIDIVASGRGSKLAARLTGALHIDSIVADGWQKNAPLLSTHRDDEAAILFTSGSTGPPKGVAYTHGMFAAQVSALRSVYNMQPGEIDVACLPVFALFSPALGMTCVFPEMNPSKPGQVDPAKLARTIQAAGATTAFGSPAIWRRVVPWCIANDERLPTLKRVLIAGAPVPTKLIADFHRLLDGSADVHTPYGATECLPVSSAAGRDLVAGGVGSIRARAESGSGTCVGRIAPGIELRLIEVETEPIRSWEVAKLVDHQLGSQSALGEVVVRGPVVTRIYKHEPRHTEAAKIPVSDADAPFDKDEVWHRIGDVGYFDADGLLWFCGRISHRLQTAKGMLMPVPTENVFNTHDQVHRSALVGLGEADHEIPTLVVQLEDGATPSSDLAQALFAHVQDFEVCAAVESLIFKSDFPVDVRHNAKIHRGELRTWAAAQPVSQFHKR